MQSPSSRCLLSPRLLHWFFPEVSLSTVSTSVCRPSLSHSTAEWASVRVRSPVRTHRFGSTAVLPPGSDVAADADILVDFIWNSQQSGDHVRSLAAESGSVDLNLIKVAFIVIWFDCFEKFKKPKVTLAMLSWCRLPRNWIVNLLQVEVTSTRPLLELAQPTATHFAVITLTTFTKTTLNTNVPINRLANVPRQESVFFFAVDAKKYKPSDISVWHDDATTAKDSKSDAQSIGFDSVEVFIILLMAAGWWGEDEARGANRRAEEWAAFWWERNTTNRNQPLGTREKVGASSLLWQTVKNEVSEGSSSSSSSMWCILTPCCFSFPNTWLKLHRIRCSGRADWRLYMPVIKADVQMSCEKAPRGPTGAHVKVARVAVDFELLKHEIHKRVYHCFTKSVGKKQLFWEARVMFLRGKQTIWVHWYILILYLNQENVAFHQKTGWRLSVKIC